MFLLTYELDGSPSCLYRTKCGQSLDDWELTDKEIEEQALK